MSKRRRVTKLVLLLIEIVIVVVLIIGMVFVKNLGSFNRVDLNQSQVDTNDMSDATIASFTGYTTIALFGLDNREVGNLDAGLSDVIMIMSINNDTQDVKLVSVYRDTYLDIGPEGEQYFQKANAAYSFAGPERAVSMLNKNLDLKVDNYMTVDFNALSKAVDILGGITLEITDEAELKELNRVIVETNKFLGGDSPTLDSVGEHELDGIQAVSYARIRKLSGGDYKRAQRQRIVLSKMIKKAKSSNLRTINQLIKNIMPYVQSDLSESDLISMASVMIGYDMNDSRGFPFERTTRKISGIGSSVIACDLETNVRELHEYLYGASEYTPSDAVLNYSQYIINQTGCYVSSAEVDEFNQGDDFSGNAPASLPEETAESGEYQEQAQ